MNPVKENRLGRFSIQSKFIEHSQPIFEQVIITSCEYSGYLNLFKYSGYSSLFKSILPFEYIPEYSIWISEDDPTNPIVSVSEVL
jgi:hypothetical protein